MDIAKVEPKSQGQVILNFIQDDNGTQENAHAFLVDAYVDAESTARQCNAVWNLKGQLFGQLICGRDH